MIIIFQTYKRTEYALRSIAAIKEYLKYPVRWLVVDDGSDAAHVDAVGAAIGDDLMGIFSKRIGYGALANRAWKESIRQEDSLTMWIEDDWVLDRTFDPTHYINLLETDLSVGMLRLGRIPIGLHSEVVGDGSEVYLRLKRGMGGYYFSGNPSIRHSRFYEAYGDYPVGLHPGDTEVTYDRQIQSVNGIAGPDILIPVNIGTWGLFGHIGAEKSY